MTDWENIVEKHREMVWRTAYRLLGNEADAADCFQETFISALQLSRKEEVRNWSGLLRRVAITRALDQLRRRVRQKTQSVNLNDCHSLADDSTRPEQALEDAELGRQLRWALAQLPAEQAESFCLRHLEGLSYRQIARQMGIKTNTAGVLLHRACSRLQELLNPVLAGQ